MTCIHCGESLTPSDLSDGWCDNCGKKLPTIKKPEQKITIPPVAMPTVWPVILTIGTLLVAMGGLTILAR